MLPKEQNILLRSSAPSLLLSHGVVAKIGTSIAPNEAFRGPLPICESLWRSFVFGFHNLYAIQSQIVVGIDMHCSYTRKSISENVVMGS